MIRTDLHIQGIEQNRKSRTLRGIEQNIFTEIEEQTYENRGTEQNEYVIFVFAIS